MVELLLYMNTLKDGHMPTLESGLAAIATKFGWLKLGTLGASLAGALVMAMFRPPKTRREVLYHALVAAIGSYMFGPFCVSLAASWLPTGVSDIVMPVHFLVGALSWGAFSALAAWRDKLAVNPQEAIKDAKDAVQ